MSDDVLDKAFFRLLDAIDAKVAPKKLTLDELVAEVDKLTAKVKVARR